MDKEIIEIFNKEINEPILSRRKYIELNYPIIRVAFQRTYGWPELDPLRHEICLCLTFGCHQASITLTNHLLESLLKYALITITAADDENENSANGRAISYLKEKYREPQEKFGNASLHSNINSARKYGLITKDQKADLHSFREQFRNAYSHADKEKTFGDTKIPVESVHLNMDDGIFEFGEKGEPKVADFIVAHGIVQAIIAEREACSYFLYIDSLVREIYKSLFTKKKE